MAKIKIREILLERLDGYSEDDPSPQVVPNFGMAMIILTAWSHGAPRNGAYNKVRYSIFWEDGTMRVSDYKLRHFVVGIPDLRSAVLEELGTDEIMETYEI